MLAQAFLTFQAPLNFRVKLLIIRRSCFADPPSSYNITYASGRTDKMIPPVGSQSAIVLKRRRLRRHPVWRFFKDVGDGSKVSNFIIIHKISFSFTRVLNSRCSGNFYLINLIMLFA